MATLVLGAAGTLLGGPIGGAIGALAGRQLDSAILGSPSREGPRLTELAISSSSYGQPIPRHFGAVRAPGVVFWATDLVESKETSGGGKGKPKTTSYSYTVSFAVALSSTPIEGIGRIWADGDLLRGTAGDLKVAGAMRLYSGHGDQTRDSLIAAVQQSEVPAMRGCAYVVFEDLELGDFGNRIPALSFEIFERTGEPVSLPDISSQLDEPGSSLDQLVGFSDNGGALASTLSTIDRVLPVSCTLNDNGVSLSLRDVSKEILRALPAPLETSEEGSSTRSNGPKLQRGIVTPQTIGGLRYYDRERDYQISVQRSIGPSDQSSARILEFPATISAGNARSLCTELYKRERWQTERVVLKLGELDPSLTAGKFVSIPDTPGVWRILSWEWMDRGIELELERTAPASAGSVSAEAGSLLPPRDLVAQPTQLWTFELPPLDIASTTSAAQFAAVTGDPGWVGASLYSELDGELVPLDLNTRQSATIGHLASDLAASKSTHVERSASIEIDLVGQGDAFQTLSIEGIARGGNRLYLGGEILQYAIAEQVSTSRWRLTGLLRGRAGTEHLANEIRPAGTEAVLLDSSILSLSDGTIPSGTFTYLAAIGLGDTQPTVAEVQNTGTSTAPLSPVHPKVRLSANGDWSICWTRRARGAWRWLDYVDAPVVEEAEEYILGIGPLERPIATWMTAERQFMLASSEITSLAASYGPTSMWVKQVGTFSHSPATLIAAVK
jgi:hypothetical protein